MPKPPDVLDLTVDLDGGVVPISKAASSLAALIKRSREHRQPVIITQKGYPRGVILPIDLFVALRKRAGLAAEEDAPPASEASSPLVPVETSSPELEAASPEPPAPPRARGGRKARSKIEQNP